MGRVTSRPDDLLERSAHASAALARNLRRSRDGLTTTWHTRVTRVRRNAWQIGQCSVGAGLAWWLAHVLFGHSQPFFAPVAAIITLGLNWGARLSRLVEVALGVTIGIAVGDMLVSVLGHGYWQVPFVVGLAMVLAVFTGVGALLSTQAGVQAVMVTVMIPGAGQGVSRWMDALLGGVIAIAIAAVAPTREPIQRPRRLAAEAVRETRDLLLECAQALTTSDLERATRALARARVGQQDTIDELQAAAKAGLDVVNLSPWFQRNHRPALRRIAELTVPLDLAMRDERMVIRRVVSTIRRGQPVPHETVILLRMIADACDQLANDIIDVKRPGPATRLLTEAAQFSLQVPLHAGLLADVLLEQIRSMLVDLLEASGASYDDALAAVARPAADLAPETPVTPADERSAEKSSGDQRSVDARFRDDA